MVAGIMFIEVPGLCARARTATKKRRVPYNQPRVLNLFNLFTELDIQQVARLPERPDDK